MRFSLPNIVPHGTLFLLLTFSPLLKAEQGTARHLITLSSENETANTHIQTGFHDLLMGWDEMARHEFHQAVIADEGSAMAWLGLMLTEGVTQTNYNALSHIISGEYLPTPQEVSLLENALLLAYGDAGRAGEAFAQRAEQYRNDKLSACWAVRLLHDRYEDINGKAYPKQAQALDIVQRLYIRWPDDALISFLRGWVEESSLTPSDEALRAAKFAVESMPEHPAAHLLHAHLLYRKGHLRDSISSLQHALTAAENARKNVPCGTNDDLRNIVNWPLEIRIKLYLSTLLWLDEQKVESLFLQSELLKAAEAKSVSPGAVLLHWEARTLPLRLLVLSPTLPTDEQVVAAAKAATPHASKKGDSMLELRDCLRFCVVARQRAAAGQGAMALRCIKSAEACLKRLEGAKEQCAGQGDYVCSSWYRAVEAGQQALLAAKAAAYPDTADIWLQSLEHAVRPTSLLMPPVLPKK